MAKYKIVFFLEDTAQEAFIRAMVERLIRDESKNINDYDLQVLSARGGGSIRAYKDFLKHAKRRNYQDADCLIVGSDGNCNGFTKRKQQLTKASNNLTHPTIITAVPDPHIERWYILDSQALARAAGVTVQVVSPTVKCDKNHYKNLLKKVFTDQNIVPPLGGAEYGELVANEMDIYNAGVTDHSLKDFIDQVKSWLRRQG